MLQTPSPGALLQHGMHPALLTVHTASQTMQLALLQVPRREGEAHPLPYPNC